MNHVLWFVNKVPLDVARAAGETGVRGGWIDAYVEIARTLPDLELTVAFPDWTRRSPDTSIGGVRYVGLPTGDDGSAPARILTRWRHDAAPRDLVAAASALVRAVAPDLVHVHGADGPWGPALADCGAPVLLSVQGSPTAIRGVYSRGIDRHYVRSLSLTDFLRGVGGVHRYLSLRSRASSEARAMAAASHVAGRTDWDRRLAAVMAPQAAYHHCDEPLRTGFGDASWDPRTAIAGRILSVSGQYPLKGVGTLLRAFATLRAMRPETTLVIAGLPSTSEDERAAVRHASALGLGGCVTLAGELDEASLIEELRRASVCVNPSHMENSSNALCEAQVVGVPCVASCAGGLVSIADHGSAALLVQDGDPEALAGAVLSLLDDPDGAMRLGQRAKALAAERHDRERIRTQLSGIYAEMLGGS